MNMMSLRHGYSQDTCGFTGDYSWWMYSGDRRMWMVTGYEPFTKSGEAVIDNFGNLVEVVWRWI